MAFHSLLPSAEKSAVIFILISCVHITSLNSTAVALVWASRLQHVMADGIMVGGDGGVTLKDSKSKNKEFNIATLMTKLPTHKPLGDKLKPYQSPSRYPGDRQNSQTLAFGNTTLSQAMRLCNDFLYLK
jgi:hypothetical protein